MTFEFPLTEPHAFEFHGARRSQYTLARLKRLVAIAAKLYLAGWPVWVTMTGLAFEAPGFNKAFENDDEYQEQLELVYRQLADLGIDEAFKEDAGKTVDQLPDGWLYWMWDPAEVK
jgi:hypothetical protein